VLDHLLAPVRVTVRQIWVVGPHGLRGYVDGFLLGEAEASISAARLPTCVSRRLCLLEIVGCGLALTPAIAQRGH
jgi:hypothetical protein